MQSGIFGGAQLAQLAGRIDLQARLRVSTRACTRAATRPDSAPPDVTW